MMINKGKKRTALILSLTLLMGECTAAGGEILASDIENQQPDILISESLFQEEPDFSDSSVPEEDLPGEVQEQEAVLPEDLFADDTEASPELFEEEPAFRLEGEELEASAAEKYRITQVFWDWRLQDFVKENYDLDRDGFLSDQERLSVTEMDVSGLGIQRLDGIEAFENLEILDCSRNGLKSLEQAGRLTGLKRLDCSENELTDLDTDRNVLLEQLDCSNNVLTSLQVDKAVRLKKLDCSQNRLTILHLEKNQSLQELDCSENQLVGIDVRNCPLKSFSWENNVFYTGAVQWGLEKFPQLFTETVTGFENLKWKDNHTLEMEDSTRDAKIFCTLDSVGSTWTVSFSIRSGYFRREDFADSRFYNYLLDKCNKTAQGLLTLEDLAAVTQVSIPEEGYTQIPELKYLVNLKVLNCQGNSLETLDLSACMALEELNCSKNPMLKEIVWSKKGYERLKKVEAADCSLTEFSLLKASALKVLNLRGNNLTQLRLTGFPSLEEADCRFNTLQAPVEMEGISSGVCAKSPQKSYQVQTGPSNRFSFQEIGNFQKDMKSTEEAVDLLGMSADWETNEFVVNAYSGSSRTVSFSIRDKETQDVIGICRIKASLQPGSEEGLKLAAPKLVKLDTSQGMTLSWKKVEDASGYVVYRKQGNSGWSLLKTLNGTQNSYTDNTAELNKSYTYTVRARCVIKGKNILSSYNKKGLTGKIVLKAPVLKSLKQGQPLVVQWNAVPGAQGYSVFRKTDNKGSWQRIGVTDSTTLLFEDNPWPKHTYTYTVRAFMRINGKIRYGSYDTKGVTAKALLMKGEFRYMKRKDSQVEIYWYQRPYATAYQLYRSDSRNGTFRLFKEYEEDGNNKALLSLSQVNGYYFKIRPVCRYDNKTVTGALSQAKSMQELLTYDLPASYDLSEYQLAYSAAAGDGIRFDYSLRDGGNFLMAAAAMAAWRAPVLEYQAPYPGSYDQTYTPSDRQPAFHLQEMLVLPARTSAADNQAVKEAVMNYGAVYASYCDRDEYANNDGSYYYAGDPEMAVENHAIVIVGWDDSYSRNYFKDKPPGDGAFLCKSSYGRTEGIDGFFYLSYYDPTLMKNSNGAVFSGMEGNSSYGKIYQYDELGAVTAYGTGKTTYQANVFPGKRGLTQDENLKAVSFYTYDAGYTYEIYVVTNYKGEQSLEKLGSPVKRGTMAYAGYHTIQLTKPVKLAKGSRFAVVVKLSANKTVYGCVEAPIDGYSSKASAARGESFVSANGSLWTDMTEILPNTNVCVKAFTDGQGEGGTVDRQGEELSDACQPWEVSALGFVLNASAMDAGNQGEMIPVPMTFGSTKPVKGISSPEQYDLRAYAQVTAVKNQMGLNTCWAFAALASAESCLLKKQG